jgi:putative aldouronate transport system substrate-binding protein
MKKTLLIILVVVLAFSASALFARGEKEAAASKDGVPMSGEGPSWTWDKSDWSTSWYFSTTYSRWGKYYDPELNIVSKKIYEATGLKEIEFILAEDGENQKLTAMIAANNLTDIVTCSRWHSPQIGILKEGKLVHDLFALSDKYNAEFKAELQKYPSLVNWYSADTGELYFYPSQTWPSELLDTELGQHAQAMKGVNPIMIANEALLKQAGVSMSDFDTLDSTFNALKKFKDAGITYNGNTVYALNPGGEFGTAGAMSYMARLIGLAYEDKNGNYVSEWMSPQFKEMAQFISRCYREGLIPQEQFLWENDQIREKVAAGQYFVGMGGMGGHHNWFRQLFEESNKTQKFIPVGPPKSDSGLDPAIPTSKLAGSLRSFISLKADDPGRLIRFFSYMVQPETQFMVYWGVEGETFEFTPEGYVDLNEEIKKWEDEDVEIMIKQWGLKHIFYTHRHDIVRYGYTPPPDRPAEEMTFAWSDHYKEYGYPGEAVIDLNPPSDSEEAEIKTSIEIYMDEQVPKMILAESDAAFETVYDETMKKIKEMGLEQLVKWQNEEMWKRKEKLGVNIVTPRYK